MAKESGSRKNMWTFSNSHNNSPGKLMNKVNCDHSSKYKSPKQSPSFSQSAEVRKSGSSKTIDFINVVNLPEILDDCEKCKRRMRLEQKQSQNIPLTEAEKKELNFVKMEMMIFDVRYKELQEHGTLPNWFRFSLEEHLTEKMVDKFIQDYSCIKEAAGTICILGASNLTSDVDNLSGVEQFHLKAVNKIIK